MVELNISFDLDRFWDTRATYLCVVDPIGQQWKPSQVSSSSIVNLSYKYIELYEFISCVLKCIQLVSLELLRMVWGVSVCVCVWSGRSFHNSSPQIHKPNAIAKYVNTLGNGEPYWRVFIEQSINSQFQIFIIISNTMHEWHCSHIIHTHTHTHAHIHIWNNIIYTVTMAKFDDR